MSYVQSDISPEYDNEKQRKARNDDIRRLLHPERGHFQHHIPQSTAADSRHEAYDICPEPVEILGRCKPYSAYRKSECPYIVYDVDEIH